MPNNLPDGCTQKMIDDHFESKERRCSRCGSTQIEYSDRFNTEYCASCNSFVPPIQYPEE